MFAERASSLAVLIVLTVLGRQTYNVSALCENTCDSGSCYTNSVKCNYFDDCGDRTDEMNCAYPTVDGTIALVYIVNDRSKPTSTLYTLSGNPDDYVWELGNSSLNTYLPINVHLQITQFDEAFQSLAVDYTTRSPIIGGRFFQAVVVGPPIDNASVVVSYSNDFTAQPSTSQIPSVTHDWFSQNIYWVDQQYNSINVLSRKNNVWKTVISTDLTLPRAIVVNPLQTMLFWTDVGKIERSDLVGNNRLVILSSNSTITITAPNKLVIDFNENQLYWLDASSSLVGRCNFDGTQATTWNQSEFSIMSTMALYKNFMYFGDSRSSIPTIYIYDIATFSRIASFFPPSPYRSTLTGAVVDMFMMASSNQPSGTSPCQTANGSCKQLCFTTSSVARQCGCGLGFTVSNADCASASFSSKVSYLLVADYNQRSVYQVKPDTGELRVLQTDVSASAVAFDPTTMIFYVAHRQKSPTNPSSYRYVIQRTSTDGRIVADVIYTAASNYFQIVHLAIDVSRQLLFFTDRFNKSISVMSTDGTNFRILVNFDSTLPEALTYDSTNGLLYWSTCVSNDKPQIQVQNVVSTNDIRTLYTGQQLNCISGLTIDVTNQILYFTTKSSSTSPNSTINMLSLSEKNNVATVLYVASGGNYRSLALFNGSLYIADDSNRTIQRYDLSLNAVFEQIPRQFSNASDITARDASATISSATLTARMTTTSTVASTEGQTSSAGIIAAVVVSCAAVVIVLIIAALIVAYNRNRNKRSKDESVSPYSGIVPAIKGDEPIDNRGSDVYDSLDDVAAGQTDSVYSEIADDKQTYPPSKEPHSYEALRRTAPSRPIYARNLPTSLYPVSSNSYIDLKNYDGYGSRAPSAISSIAPDRKNLQTNIEDCGVYITPS